MANPFKEADKRKKVAPETTKTDPPAPVVEETPAPVPVTETSDTIPMVGKEFLAKFVEQKTTGKAHSIYLSDEAGKKLEKLAKQLKCSKSKALDILLRNAVE